MKLESNGGRVSQCGVPEAADPWCVGNDARHRLYILAQHQQRPLVSSPGGAESLRVVAARWRAASAIVSIESIWIAEIKG